MMGSGLPMRRLTCGTRCWAWRTFLCSSITASGRFDGHLGCVQQRRAPYPLYGGVCQSGDVMNMSNALWGWEGLKKLDFLLDIDLWHTPTSQLADILLPARHWLEVDCPRRSQGSGGMEGSHCKCVEPLGESWFDVDIIIQLCKAMGIPWSADPDDPWPDSIKELDAACEPMGLTWEE
mgnify:CR=1 FL=1